MLARLANGGYVDSTEPVDSDVAQARVELHRLDHKIEVCRPSTAPTPRRRKRKPEETEEVEPETGVA